MDNLKDDLALQLALYYFGQIHELNREKIRKLAACLDFPFDWNQSEKQLQLQASALLNRYSQQATVFVLDKVREFAAQHDKKLLVILFSPDRALPQLAQGSARFDQETVDYLRQSHVAHFDMNEVMLREFRNYRLSLREYTKQYFVSNGFNVGHLNPRGNNLFAYSVKDTIVKWLDPKPFPYRPLEQQRTNFKYYVPASAAK